MDAPLDRRDIFKQTPLTVVPWNTLMLLEDRLEYSPAPRATNNIQASYSMASLSQEITPKIQNVDDVVP